MSLLELLIITFVAAAVTNLATGLGAVPFFFFRSIGPRVQGMLTGAAAGMMTVASVVQLFGEAIARVDGGQWWHLAIGFVGGIVFFIVAARWIHANEEMDILELRKQGGSSALLIVVAMTIHSLPEGVAIGVAYGTAAESGSLVFGTMIALMLALHNIPEGLAIAAALRGQGVSPLRCVWWAVFSSIPQPLAAVPAAWAVWAFEPLLPAGLCFAAGAMMYLVVTELMPDTYKRIGAGGTALSFLGGAALMYVIGLGLAAM